MAGQPVSLESRIGKISEVPVCTAFTTEKAFTSTPPPTVGGSGLNEPEYEVAVKLADLQGDPNSPLYSVKRFEDLGLSQELLEGIYFMNFKKPSKIQERALPLLLSNPSTNMIGQSQSGTGKTAAFVLTMLTRIDMSATNVQAVCLTPTRELARQIMSVTQTMGQFTNVKTQFAIPNMVQRGQKIDAHIVVGTPGTVLDLIRRKQLPVEHLKVFVLDEADNMLDLQGLGEQCLRVKSYSWVPNITLKQEELTVEGIKQLCMDCDSQEDKYRMLLELYHILTIGSSIIFVKKRETASEIQRRMEADGHKVAALHGAQEGADRDRVIDDFRSGKAKVLITTNVLARGIDVATVSMVVNYDIPLDQNGQPDPLTYLHRIGRTGRFGRVGVSISFVHDEQTRSEMNQISNFFGISMTRVPTNDIDVSLFKISGTRLTILID
ncbi:P-loop containing nucleoside triphosphate hydrolase protein, partial [Tuber indicum]